MAIKENIFSIISDFHSACGHKGEKKTYKAVSEQYANISMPFIKQFIAQCERCAEKSKRISQKGIVVRPITSDDLNQRGQVDLVDFQSLPDGEFKYILHYKEHLTKYSFLRPLVSKKAIEVARELFNIFLDFSAPHILQSDNGREFTADIIKELASLWPNLIFINGRPRHPQSQGSVERSNCTLKNSLIAWMRDNKTSSWSLGLRIVQWGMNTTYHEGIKISPYVAMFGQKAKMSLTSKLPKDFLNKISTRILEEEMEDLIKFDNENEKQETIENIFESITRQQSNDDENNVAEEEFSFTTKINSNNSLAQKQVEAMITEQQKFEDLHISIAEEAFSIGKEININNLSLQVPEVRETLSNTVPCDTENQIATDVLHPAVKCRKLASINLLAQASKMLDRSNKTLSSFKPGDNVLVGIS